MKLAEVTRKYLIAIAPVLIVWSLALIIPPAHASPVPTQNTTLSPTAVNQSQVTSSVKHATLLKHLPMDFIENRGQWQTPAKFVARKGALTAALAQDGITLRYGNQEALRLHFEGTSNNPVLVGEVKRVGHYNYIRGNDPQDWQLQVPSYESVLYRSLYDGVDLRVREEAGKLEYEVLLEPNADISRVVVRAEGTLKLELGDDRALLLHTGSGVIRQTPPHTWEVLPSGEKRIVTARFRIIDNERYGFAVPQRDHKLALVIDPGLDWSTFLGGGLEDFVNGVDIARDGSGDILVTGVTSSTDFPQANFTVNSQKVYVTRLNAAGNALQYVTFLSGNAATGTYVGRLAADESGGVAVVGYTNDTTFPVTLGAYQTSIRGGGDVFVVRLNHLGVPTASTLLGGTADEAAAFTSRGIAFDPSGSVIISGVTLSADFPTTVGAFDRTFNPTNAFSTDTFIARLSPDLSQLTYSTFFSVGTWVKELVVDPLGFVTIAGETGGGLPTTAGALDRVWNNGVTGVSGEDGFVSRFKLDGAGLADLKYSTYLGGHNRDEAWGLALDPNNSELVTVVGWTWQNAFARDFPTTPGAYRPNPLPQTTSTPSDPYVQEGFVSRFRFPAAGGGSLVWSSFIGGPLWEHATDVAVDSTGAAIVLGGTRSYDFPTTRGAYDRTLGGIVGAPYDCFISRFSADGSQLLYSTLLGGNGTDPMVGSLGNECEQPTLNDESHIIYAGGNSVIVVGETKSPDFPATSGAFDTSYATGPAGFVPTRDTFITRLTLTADDSGDLTVATPVLVSPANGAVIPNTFNVTLTWNAVADASGIEAYNYQMSSRPDFPDGFIAFRGSVRSNSLPLTSVGQTTWYWRIQAADRAGNLGEWSAPFTFRLGNVAATASLSAVSLSPTNLVGGSSATGTVILSAAAPTGGAVVSLSDNSSTVSTPASVTVPAGSTNANFNITTSSVTNSTSATISAVFSGVTRTATLTVNPSGSSSLSAPSLLSPASDATPAQPVTFDWSDVANATSYQIQVDDSSTIQSPFRANLTVSVSQVTIGGLPAQRLWWRVRAQNAAGVFGPFSSTRRFTPQATAATVSLSAVAVNPTSVVGGNASTGTATLTAAAPTGGAIVALSDNSTAVTVPTSVTIPAGATSTTFTVTTTSVSASTSVTLTGTYNATSRTATLTVTPVAAPPPAASLNTLTLNPASVTGGGTAQGTVTLTSAAPTGGAVVSLSSNTVTATVPASVTVPAGSTSANFTVTTNSVTTSTTATISAVLAGVTRTAVLTVNPVVAGVSLTVTATGRSGERVLSSPAGINVAVGSVQSASFASNSSITLSVSNGRDAIWSGACSSGGNKTRTCTFTITGNASVTGNVQ